MQHLVGSAKNMVSVEGETFVPMETYLSIVAQSHDAATMVGAAPTPAHSLPTLSFDDFCILDLTADPAAIGPGAVMGMLPFNPLGTNYPTTPTNPTGTSSPSTAGSPSTASSPSASNLLAGWLTVNHARAGDLLFGSHTINYMTFGRTQHAALVQDVGGQLVIEADASGIGTDKPGVRTVDWLSWAARYAVVYLVRVKDVTDEQALQVLAWAIAHTGIPYRWPVADGTDKNNDHRMYCSQMVWVAHLRVLNIDLDRDGGSLVFPDDIFYNSAKVYHMAQVRGR